MSEAAGHGLSSALVAKAQAFADTLTPEEVADLQEGAQRLLGLAEQGEVKGYASSAAPAAGQPLEQEVPTALAAKLRQLAASLTEDERSECDQVAQAAQGEVQGYLAPVHRQDGGGGSFHSPPGSGQPGAGSGAGGSDWGSGFGTGFAAGATTVAVLVLVAFL